MSVMKEIESKSIDMALCDLSFEMTNNDWNKIIPFKLILEEVLRITKDNATIVFMLA